MEEEAEENANIYTLKTPIEWGKDEAIETIELTEPTGKDLAGIKVGLPIGDDQTMTIDYTMALRGIKACCTLPPAAINKMKASDVTNCWVQAFGLFF